MEDVNISLLNDNSIITNNDEILILLQSIQLKLNILEDIKPKVDKLYDKALDEEGN